MGSGEQHAQHTEHPDSLSCASKGNNPLARELGGALSVWCPEPQRSSEGKGGGKGSPSPTGSRQ